MRKTAAAARRRCPWAEGDALLARYHDAEWGAPVRTNAAHLERLSLEVFQAGLSWRTILHKRKAFRRAFERFAPRKVAAYGEREVRRLLADAGIVRHRMKIEATIENARRLIALAERHGSFARWLGSLPGGRARLRDALRREFRFMGPKIAESYLESVGRVAPRHHPRCWMARPKRGA